MGSRDGDCTRISRLRYAKPPVGPLRFALPQPVEAWGEPCGGEPAQAVVAPQLPSRLARVMGDYAYEISEDCLHLDIWIPDDVSAPMLSSCSSTGEDSRPVADR